MHGAVVIVRNPFDPARDREVHAVAAPSTIRQWLDGHGIEEFALPTLCLLDGAPVLRADWASRPIGPGQVCAFVALPGDGGGGGDDGGGGGGSDPVRIVATIAVLIAAVYLGGALAEAMAITSVAGIAAVTSAVAVVGMALVGAILPPPKPALPSYSWSDTSGVGGGGAGPSPTYSLQGQGNAARLEQPIPEWFGRHMMVPDLAMETYQEYSGNEQYLYQAFCLGQGDIAVEAIRIDDTPIANFDEITTELVGPTGAPSLFPINVTTSAEVVGQDMKAPNEGGDWIGPFTLNPAETHVTAIGVDWVCPRGLYVSLDNGSLDGRTVSWAVEARMVDAEGAALGGWVQVGAGSHAAATMTAQRVSAQYTVAPGRYEVRARRTDLKDPSIRAGHDLRWQGVRGYLQEVPDWSGKTVLLVKARATDQLSARSSRMVNVIATRKLRPWSPSGGWGAAVATRSIAWAAAHICTSANGWGLPDHRVDLAALHALDQAWTARGDTFDAGFDAGTTVWDALQTVLRAGRSAPIQQRGIVRFVRDEPKTIPTSFFGPRNIVKGSFSIKYTLPGEETADAVEISYFSAKTWKPARVTAKVTAGAAVKPAKVKMLGVTNRDHAHREGWFLAACNLYRRRNVTFRTAAEGLSCAYGDLIMVSHPMPAWGQGGDVLGWDDGTTILTLSEPPRWTPGATHYIALRRRDNGMAGPFRIEPVTGDDRAVHVLDELDITPYVGGDELRTQYTLGPDGGWGRLARVRGIVPRGRQVEITAVIEDDRVHADPPPVPS